MNFGESRGGGRIRGVGVRSGRENYFNYIKWIQQEKKKTQGPVGRCVGLHSWDLGILLKCYWFWLEGSGGIAVVKLLRGQLSSCSTGEIHCQTFALEFKTLFTKGRGIEVRASNGGGDRLVDWLPSWFFKESECLQLLLVSHWQQVEVSKIGTPSCNILSKLWSHLHLDAQI